MTEIEQAISDIIQIKKHHSDFWSNGAWGWAPQRASALLEKSRLDRQVSLAHCLNTWLKAPAKEEYEGYLILAWTNLGSLVEGTLKWFLCVYADDYDNNPLYYNNGNAIEPDELFLGKMISFFVDVVWSGTSSTSWSVFLHDVRKKRNTIHSYQDHKLGTFEEFCQAVIDFRNMLVELEHSVPYPDEYYAYPYEVNEIIRRVNNSTGNTDLG